MRWTRKAVALVALVAVALAVVYVVARGYPSEIFARAGEAGSSRPALPVHRLDGVTDLQAAFNAQQGTPRLVVLLSPT